MATSTGKIQYIKDPDTNGIVLPVTHERGVVDSSGVNLQTKLAQKIGSDDIDNVVELTQTQYDALQSKDSRTMYIISDSTVPSDHVGIASFEQTTTSSQDGGTNIWTVTLTNDQTFTLAVKNGNQGNSGYTGAAGELEVVNNLTSGGATKALSAEMGKTLEGEISQLGLKVDDLNLLEEIDLSSVYVRNGYIKLNGTFQSSSAYRCYTIYNNNFKTVIFYGCTDNDTLAIAFYDRSGTLISGSSVPGLDVVATRSVKKYKCDSVPSNAYTILFSTAKDYQISAFYLLDCEEANQEIYDEIDIVGDGSYYIDQGGASNSLNVRIRFDTKELIASQVATTYYFENDGYSHITVTQRIDSATPFVVFGFRDASGNWLADTYNVPSKKGTFRYTAAIPASASMIIASLVETDLNSFSDIRLYKKHCQKNTQDTLDSTLLEKVDYKNRYNNDYEYRGYIRNDTGLLVSSSGSKTLLFKNHGYTSIEVYSSNPISNQSLEDTEATFNVISFYECDAWLGGQNYMQSDSVKAIYGSRRRYYSQIPSGCGIIMVTLDTTVENDAITVFKGTKSVYLNTIHSVSDVGFVLPPYCTESYMRNKINLIKARQQANASNSDSFIFMTDEHIELNQLNSFPMVRYLCDKLNIPRLFSCGDFAHRGLDIDSLHLRRKSFDGKIYQAVGNHEYLSRNLEEDGPVKEDDVFYAYYEDAGNEYVFGNKLRHYYYVDNSVQKIRYIILNAFKQGDGITNSATLGYEQEQLTWLSNVALNVESGWDILIFTHRLFEGTAANPSNVYIPENCQPVADIIEQYSGNGTILAVFQGHTHFDRIKWLKNNTIPVVITTSDHNGSYRYDDELQEYIRDYDVDRESGTINEQAFDVVVVNRTLRRIYCIRMGCPARDGSNANGELVQERVIVY